MSLFGSEITSLVPVTLVTAAVVLSFPREALTFRPPADEANVRTGSAGASFVTLDERTEAESLLKVRDTWRKGGGERGRVYADLLFADLPEAPNRPMLSVDSRPASAAFPLVEAGRSPYLPSRRAADPVRLPDVKREEVLPFPREELLKID